MKLLARREHVQAAIGPVAEWLGEADRRIEVAVVRMLARTLALLMPLEVAGGDASDAARRQREIEKRVHRLEQ